MAGPAWVTWAKRRELDRVGFAAMISR
jgi:hypothetical protein